MVLGLVKVSVYQGVSAGSTQSTHHTPSLHREARPASPPEQTGSKMRGKGREWDGGGVEGLINS